jgi:bacillithiol system protein YtxJ
VSILTTALSLALLLQLVSRPGLLDRIGRRHFGVRFVPVADLDALERVFTASDESTVVLFLHDPYCPISARAHRRVGQAGGEIHLIDVSRQHELNRAVAERTGVRHESPQAFVLREGKPVWYASHGAITTEGLDTARGL